MICINDLYNLFFLVPGSRPRCVGSSDESELLSRGVLPLFLFRMATGQSPAAIHARSKGGKHWSGVENGQAFSHSFDVVVPVAGNPSATQSVTVDLIRDADTGRSVSVTAGFVWAAAHFATDTRAQVEKFALRCEKLNPNLIELARKLKKPTKQTNLLSFRSPSASPATPTTQQTPVPEPVRPASEEGLDTEGLDTEMVPSPKRPRCDPPNAMETEQWANLEGFILQLQHGVVSLPGKGTVNACAGYTIDLPAPVNAHYPFMMHTLVEVGWKEPAGGTTFALPRADGQGGCRQWVLQPVDIGVEPALGPSPCDMCRALATNPVLLDVLQRARDPTVAASRMNDVFLSFIQMKQRRDLHKQRASLHRVLLWKQNAKLARFARVHDSDRKLLRLLSENEIPRVRLLLARQMKHGASTAAIIKQLHKAIDAAYRPVGDYSDREQDKAELALLLGGPRLLYALQRTDGFPSRRYITSRADRVRFISSWHDQVLRVTVDENLRNFALRSPVPAAHPRALVSVHTLMIDDVNCEERSRPSP